MPDKRLRSCGRRNSGTFVLLPHAIMDDMSYRNLTNSAKALLLDLLRQYNGRNNGALSACWTLMRKKGWRSKDTLHRALSELLRVGLVVKVAQGGLKPLKHSQYAIVFLALDDVHGMDDAFARKIGTRLTTLRQSQP